VLAGQMLVRPGAKVRVDSNAPSVAPSNADNPSAKKAGQS